MDKPMSRMECIIVCSINIGITLFAVTYNLTCGFTSCVYH